MVHLQADPRRRNSVERCACSGSELGRRLSAHVAAASSDTAAVPAQSRRSGHIQASKLTDA